MKDLDYLDILDPQSKALALKELPKMKQSERNIFFSNLKKEWGNQGTKAYQQWAKTGAVKPKPVEEPGLIKSTYEGVKGFIQSIPEQAHDLVKNFPKMVATEGMQSLTGRGTTPGIGPITAPKTRTERDQAKAIRERGSLVYVKDGKKYQVSSDGKKLTPMGLVIGGQGKAPAPKDGLYYENRESGPIKGYLQPFDKVNEYLDIKEKMAGFNKLVATGATMLLPGAFGKTVLGRLGTGAGIGFASEYGSAKAGGATNKEALQSGFVGGIGGAAFQGGGELFRALKAFRAGKIEKAAVTSRINKLVNDLEDDAVPMAQKAEAYRKLTAENFDDLKQFVDPAKLKKATEGFTAKREGIQSAQKAGTGRIQGRQEGFEAIQQRKALDAVIAEKAKAIDDIDREIIRLEGSPYTNDDNYWKAVDLKTKRTTLQNEIDRLMPKPQGPPAPAAIGRAKPPTIGAAPKQRPSVIGGAPVEPGIAPAPGRTVIRGRVDDAPVPGQPSAVRQTYETAADSKILLPEVRERVAKLVDEESDEVMRRTIGNDESIALAEAMFKGKNLDDPADIGDAYDQVKNYLSYKQKGGADPLVSTLLVMKGIGSRANGIKAQMAAQVNDEARTALQKTLNSLIDKQGELLNLYAKAGSERGRNLQIMKLLKSMDPDAMTVQVTRLVKRGIGKGIIVNKNVAKNVGKNVLQASPGMTVAAAAKTKQLELEAEADAMEATDPQGAAEKRELALKYGLAASAAVTLVLGIAITQSKMGTIGKRGGVIMPDAEKVAAQATKTVQKGLGTDPTIYDKILSRFGKEIKREMTPQGQEKVRQLVQQYQKSGDATFLTQIEQVIGEEIPPNIWQKISGLTYIGMLSNPKTWGLNLTNGVLNATFNTLEKYPAALVDLGLTKLKSSAGRSLFAPSPKEAIPHLKSYGRALIRGAQRNVTGSENPVFSRTLDFAGTGDVRGMGYIRGKKAFQGGFGKAVEAFKNEGLKGGVRELASAPLAFMERLVRAGMNAPDEAVKTIALLGSIENDLKAKAAALGIEDFKLPEGWIDKVVPAKTGIIDIKAMNKLLPENLQIDDVMLDRGFKQADEWTYQDETQLGHAMNWMRKGLGVFGVGTQGARMSPNAPNEWGILDSMFAEKDLNLGQAVIPFIGIVSSFLTKAAKQGLVVPEIAEAFTHYKIGMETAKELGKFKKLPDGRQVLELPQDAQRKVAEHMGKAITGIGLVGGGYGLHQAGAFGKETEFGAETDISQGEGKVTGNLNPFAVGRALLAALNGEDISKAIEPQDGDLTFSTDIVDPKSIILKGVDKAFDKIEKGDGSPLQAPLDYVGGLTEAVEAKSFTQSLTKLFNTRDEKGKTNIGMGLINASLDLLPRLVPAPVAGVAAGLDTGERKIDRGGIDGAIQLIKNRTPIWRETLPEKIGVFGKQKNTGQPDTREWLPIFINILDKTLNPVRTARIQSTPEGSMALGLSKATGRNVYPPDMQKESFSIDGKEYKISEEMAVNLAKYVGQQSADVYRKYMGIGGSPETIAKMIEKETNQIAENARRLIIAQYGLKGEPVK